MRVVFYILILISLGSIWSCAKDKTPLPPPPEEPEVWEKFVGNYNVYDTNGNYLYQLRINHYYHNDNYGDSLLLENFNANFDLKIQFLPHPDGNVLNYGFYDSIKGYDNHSWTIGSNIDDSTTEVIENKLINDSIILYFRQTNIQYWINEGVPYYYCDCKQVAVKQY
ncbi:hypothetical protein [Parvicella tangerina]|uniref:Uncharacterized protein n=1 Tax=Parvicella tangerina TaxID=2829795 RepID=A0A916NHT2_9FLAO|nr:hypothetical protein [Parvicella tangerina]CAG5082299.1 hypothetical protein CRYO30217_01870 [Parvicella tangerina]